MKPTEAKYHTGRFALRTLMLFTALVALIIAGIPVVVALPFELLAIAVTVLAVIALVVAESDFSVGCRLAAIAFLGLFTFAFCFQALLGGPTNVQPSWGAIVFCAFVCLVSLTMTRPRGTRFASILVSAVLATTLLFQFFSTSDDRHFLKRFRQFDNDGGISYRFDDNVVGPSRLQFVRDSWPRILAEHAMSYLDEHVWPDISKNVSLICSAKTIRELSFVGHLTKGDRSALQSQSQLEHLSFSGADLNEEDVSAFSNLDIHSLSFFNCSLPPGFLRELPFRKELWLLQIQNARSGDLDGLSTHSELGQLYLSGLSLSPSDYRELANLLKLSELDLSGTRVTDESLSIFAKELMSTSTAIRRRFRLKIQFTSTQKSGLHELLNTDLIHELIIVDSPLTSSEFLSLQARYPGVKFINAESKE